VAAANHYELLEIATDASQQELRQAFRGLSKRDHPDTTALPASEAEAAFRQLRQAYAGDEFVVKVRDRELRTKITTTSLSGTRIRKVVLPDYEDHGELLKWLLLENVPGSYPYTAGVFAFKREGEDPTRMFAGEGDPFRTNRRFKLLSEGMPAKRLSTAFDSVTLYGRDPNEEPDVYGKVGTSGVSIATLDDMSRRHDVVWRDDHARRELLCTVGLPFAGNLRHALELTAVLDVL
jgi:hypothetical protein